MKKIFVFFFLLLCTQLPLLAFSSSKFSYSAPSYYALEDLRSALKQESFYFANNSRPSSARVDLGVFPIYPTSADKNARLCRTLVASPSAYRIKASSLFDYWNDGYNLTFNWIDFHNQGGVLGDLIFTRGNFAGSDIVKIFSNWTHVAIANDYVKHEVFESTPKTGAELNNTDVTWGNGVCYYTCKKIVAVSYSAVANCVANGITKYRKKPYLPSVLTSQGLSSFLLKWSDKNNLESMYCSKLVYNTFRPAVDLDSNNSSIVNCLLWENAPYGFAFSWIGVSPDDVYYSPALGSDFCYSSNLVSEGKLW